MQITLFDMSVYHYFRHRQRFVRPLNFPAFSSNYKRKPRLFRIYIHYVNKKFGKYTKTVKTVYFDSNQNHLQQINFTRYDISIFTNLIGVCNCTFVSYKIKKLISNS
jgi:hypothetical protein